MAALSRGSNQGAKSGADGGGASFIGSVWRRASRCVSCLPASRPAPPMTQARPRARAARPACRCRASSASNPTRSMCAKGPSTDQAIVWVFSPRRAARRGDRRIRQLAARPRQRRRRRLGVPQPAQRAAHRARLALDQDAGKRAALFAQVDRARAPSPSSQPSVLGNVLSCDGEWCELSVDDYSGYRPAGQAVGRLSRRGGEVAALTSACGSATRRTSTSTRRDGHALGRLGQAFDPDRRRSRYRRACPNSRRRNGSGSRYWCRNRSWRLRPRPRATGPTSVNWCSVL